MTVDPTADRMLTAAQAGSNRAWAALVQRLDPRARHLAHLVMGGHDVDQVLLAAYIRAYRGRRRAGDDAAVFLLNQVWTACGHALRRHQRRGAPAPGRRASAVDRSPRLGDDALGRAVASLRPEERAVWALVERDGLPAEVAAPALGVSTAVVEAVADRVRAATEEALLVATEPTTGDPEVVAPAEEADAAGGPRDGEDPGGLEPELATVAFWSELGRRLQAERDALPAAPRPRLPEPGDPSPALTPAKAPPVAMQKRAPRRSRRSRPDLVEGLAEEAERQRVRRPWPSVALRVAAVAVPTAVVAALVVVLYLAATSAESPPRGATTAEVAGRSLATLASAEGWTATVTRSARGFDGELFDVTSTVTTREDGSYRSVDEGSGRVITYDARLGLLQDDAPGFGIRHEVGVAPGPPDPTVPRAELPTGEIALAVRTLAVETTTEPVRAEVDGAEVWHLAGGLAGGLELTYTVRVVDLVPVRITWTADGEVQRDVVFSDVTLGVSEAPFVQDLTPEAPPATPMGFTAVQIGEIQGRIGMVPLTPNFLPPGFDISGAWIHEGSRIASLRYSRGPAEIVVTLRPSPVEAGNRWDDPFDRSGEDVEPRAVTLGQGPFRDVEVQVVSGGMALPSVWGADGDRAFTVAGDLTPDELLEVARSLG